MRDVRFDFVMPLSAWLGQLVRSLVSNHTLLLFNQALSPDLLGAHGRDGRFKPAKSCSRSRRLERRPVSVGSTNAPVPKSMLFESFVERFGQVHKRDDGRMLSVRICICRKVNSDPYDFAAPHKVVRATPLSPPDGRR